MANPFALMPQPPPPPPPPPPIPRSPSGASDGEGSSGAQGEVNPTCFSYYTPAKCKQKEMQFRFVAAIESGDLQRVQKLVSSGVYIDCIILLVKTPLIHAMEQGHEHIASFLISAGADPNKPEKIAWLRQPIHTAVFKNMYNIVIKLLVHGANIEAQDGNGMTPLLYSAIYGCVEITKLLISYGANMNMEDFVQRSALHFAAERNFMEIAEFLMTIGTDIDHQDKYGWSALFGAIMYNHLEMVQLLLSRGADVELQDYTGDTALHLACSRFRREKVYVVLSTSEDLYKRKRRIPTLSFQNLCVRFRGSNINIVRSLIDAGACVQAHNNDGFAPLDLCKEQNVMQCLVSVGARLDPEWIGAAIQYTESDSEEFISWLLEQFQQQNRLLMMCKVAIRRHLALTKSISTAIQTLPLPKPMKEFLDLVY